MHQLILHPKDPQAVFDADILIELLRRQGLLAESFKFKDQTHYRPGEHFLELITFLGCSPVVSLGEPGLTGDDFCHIALTPEYDSTQFIHGSNIKPPRCPTCRHTHQHWQGIIALWQQGRMNTCPQCGNHSQAHELKWRQCAGFLRQGMIVWGIFEGEAVPSEQLLELLEQITGQRWSYFYRHLGI